MDVHKGEGIPLMWTHVDRREVGSKSRFFVDVINGWPPIGFVIVIHFRWCTARKDCSAECAGSYNSLRDTALSDLTKNRRICKSKLCTVNNQ